MTLLDVYALGCDHGLMATGTVAGTAAATRSLNRLLVIILQT